MPDQRQSKPDDETSGEAVVEAVASDVDPPLVAVDFEH
jgi:hypothetical protein